MKKFLSIMLCLALLLGLATTVYATGNTTTVSLEVPDETYTLKIPATVIRSPHCPPYSTDGRIRPNTSAASITPAAKARTISLNL